jgi:hypothetical protein
MFLALGILVQQLKRSQSRLALCRLSGPQYVYTNPVINAINLAIKEVNVSGGSWGGKWN